MEKSKTKGGAEKARIRKRKALEAEAAKCAKLITFFGKTSCANASVESEEQEDSGKLTTGHELRGHILSSLVLFSMKVHLGDFGSGSRSTVLCFLTYNILNVLYAK